MKLPINKIICGDCLKVMKDWPDNCVDLVVTSPPYGTLRDYQGYSFDFEDIVNQLFRILTIGGVVVWVIGDMTVDGNKTGESFRQALYFKKIGFNLHDTMIYRKHTPLPLNSKTRYQQCFEYMFVFSKDFPKVHNINQIFTKNPGKIYRVARNNPTSKGGGAINTKNKIYKSRKTKNEDNIWIISPVGSKEYFGHPAAFPLILAEKHIISWSDKDSIILDPFCGSGTTCVATKMLGRRYIGIDISKKYCEIARKRLKRVRPNIFQNLPKKKKVRASFGFNTKSKSKRKK